MPIPSKRELKNWAQNYIALWNAGDRSAWEANWRKVAPGDVRMLDPVGTPQKIGFQLCCLDSFDLFQPRVKFRIPEGMLFICDNEVAWTLENTIDTGQGTLKDYSLETYQFGDDGSVLIRTYYRVPDRTPDALGEMFETYLPEDD